MNTRSRSRKERKRKYLITFPYVHRFTKEDTADDIVGAIGWCCENFPKYMWTFDIVNIPKSFELSTDIHYEFRFTREKDLLFFKLKWE